jgi:hypothetical protein
MSTHGWDDKLSECPMVMGGTDMFYQLLIFLGVAMGTRQENTHTHTPPFDF